MATFISVLYGLAITIALFMFCADSIVVNLIGLATIAGATGLMYAFNKEFRKDFNDD